MAEETTDQGDGSSIDILPPMTRPVEIPPSWVWGPDGNGGAIWMPPGINPNDLPTVRLDDGGGFWIGGRLFPLAPGPGPVPPDLPAPPGPMPNLPLWSYQDVYDAVYQSAINQGATPERAREIASRAAERLADYTQLPQGSTPEQVAGAIDSQLPDLITAGGALVAVGGLITSYLNFVANQMNNSSGPQANLVSFLNRVCDFLSACCGSLNATGDYMAGHNIQFCQWGDLSYQIWQYGDQLAHWLTEAMSDYTYWQGFDSTNMLAGGDPLLAFTWPDRMNSCQAKWVGIINGDNINATPSYAASFRSYNLYGYVGIVVSDYGTIPDQDAWSSVPAPPTVL